MWFALEIQAPWIHLGTRNLGITFGGLIQDLPKHPRTLTPEVSDRLVSLYFCLLLCLSSNVTCNFCKSEMWNSPRYFSLRQLLEPKQMCLGAWIAEIWKMFQTPLSVGIVNPPVFTVLGVLNPPNASWSRGKTPACWFCAWDSVHPFGPLLLSCPLCLCVWRWCLTWHWPLTWDRPLPHL